MERVYDAERTQRANLDALGRLAERQNGAFTREQALRLGFTRDAIRRRVDAGAWRRIESNIFVVAGSEPTWRQKLKIACFTYDDTATVSHGSAGAFWELAGFKAALPVETIVDRRRSRHIKRPGVHWIGPVPESDVVIVDAVRVTTPSRTLLDVSRDAPTTLLEEALDDAIRRGLTSIARMRWQVSHAGPRKGITVLRTLINARDSTTAKAESVLETRVARVLRRGRFPGLVAQHEIRVGGRVVARVDFAILAARIAIECDGYQWHSGKARWEHDLARRNALTNLGWRVLHVTWTDLDHPERMVDQVEQALRARLF